MAQRDFYEVLGVSRDASGDDLRRAYRTLARQYHPDMNKAPDAAAKFNEVQQAYDILSDEQKRKTYDRYGPSAFEPGAAPPGAANGEGRSRSHAHPGAHAQGDFDPEELSEIFETFFGGGGGGSAGPFGGARPSSRQRSAPSRPEETRHEVLVGFDAVMKGGTETVRLGDHGTSKSIEVKIPRAVEDGTQLRVRGALGGRKAPRDLILTIRTGSHPLFRRGEFQETGKGLDLHLDAPLTIAEATLGATIRVPTPWGSVDLAIPAGSASGRKLRLRRQGLRDDQGREGDLYVVLKIVPPTGLLTPQEQEALRELASKSPSPRASREWQV